MIHKIVVNEERQYSIWPEERQNAIGWKDIGFSGSKEECLNHLNAIWTNLGPLNKEKMKSQDQQLPTSRQDDPQKIKPVEASQRGFFTKLGFGDEVPVEISSRYNKQIEKLKKSIEQGFVHIKFPTIQTELKIKIDRSTLIDLDSGKHSGRVRLVGTLVLNFETVRCVVDISLQTLTGSGHICKS